MGTARTDYEAMSTSERRKIARRTLTNRAISLFMRDQQKVMEWQRKRDEALRKALNFDLTRLIKITKNCRSDMHEPDCAGELRGRVRGRKLDNAFGDDPQNNRGELTVGLTKGYGKSAKTEWFNLATLIALARKANI